MKNTILLAAFAVASAAASAKAQSWGFTLGNGAGFYWGNPPVNRVYSAPAYIAPAPVYYERPVTYYQPQTVYMQPYQQMRPVYPQTIVYRSEPMVIQNHRRCTPRTAIYPNRW